MDTAFVSGQSEEGKRSVINILYFPQDLQVLAGCFHVKKGPPECIQWYSFSSGNNRTDCNGEKRKRRSHSMSACVKLHEFHIC